MMSELAMAAIEEKRVFVWKEEALVKEEGTAHLYS